MSGGCIACKCVAPPVQTLGSSGSDLQNIPRSKKLCWLCPIRMQLSKVSCQLEQQKQHAYNIVE
eukprot:4604022-Amphidinium_carterae.1